MDPSTSSTGDIKNVFFLVGGFGHFGGVGRAQPDARSSNSFFKISSNGPPQISGGINRARTSFGKIRKKTPAFPNNPFLFRGQSQPSFQAGIFQAILGICFQTNAKDESNGSETCSG